MKTIMLLVLWLGLMVTFASAQTPTPTTTPTATPTPTITYNLEPSIYQQIGSQNTRFDYIATAGDVSISSQITLVIMSVWVMFILFFVLYRKDKM
jgi:hypothetical protein